MKMLTVLLLLMANSVFAQKNNAVISGKIIDENENPLIGVSIIILGKNTGIASTDSGTFSLKVKAETALALVFSSTGHNSVQKNFFLNSGEEEVVIIKMTSSKKMLDEVVVTDDRLSNQNSVIKLNPKSAIAIPSVGGGIETMIKSFVGSNNELTSNYNVRGGNFDENLIYINDFEIYRPYLVSSGQQEGLSFINPALTKIVTFYTGGFQAKYGDKLSSVLDIDYKKPSSFNGSAYISLLEQGLHLENRKNKISYLVGIRNKSNKNVLSNQPTLGAYLPSASDIQGFINYKLKPKLSVEVLAIYSVSSFDFFPESVKKTSSVFSPFYSANLGLDIYFDGSEKDSYKTSLIGLSAIHSPNKNLRFKWMLSRFTDVEKEHLDIAGAYLFGDRDFDNSSSTFGQIVNPLGAGYYQDFARNNLKIESYKAEHKGEFSTKKHLIQWGLSAEKTKINDLLKQWQFQDSAGYSIPVNENSLTLKSYINSKADLNILKLNAYLQDNFKILKPKYNFILQTGVRFNYNALNDEMLISPRVQASLKPVWKKDIIFKASAGIYQQPPFYRELRDYNGKLNTNIKAQKSLQFVTGLDYSFKGPGNRPMKFTTEAYYKSMWDVVPYDIDNVKIRYLGSNNTKAYAAGIEMRLFGELLKDAESWISLALMKTMENIDGDHYYNYYNPEGELINQSTTDKTIADSVKHDIGFIRRPSDRFITLGIFLQDYLSTNKNFKVHLNLLYGSNMTYSIPQSARFRNALIIDPYIRLDIGFSASLISENKTKRSHDPFKSLKSAWLSLEILNIIDRQNTISYQLIKDFSNTTYAIPNRLTPRLINLKLLVSF